MMPWIVDILIEHHTIAFNFNQDFTESTHSDFFLGQTDRDLIYKPNHSREILLSRQEEEGD
jgi:hypothetical protein